MITLPYVPSMSVRIKTLLNSLILNPSTAGYKYLEDILNITTSKRRREYTSLGMLYAEVAKKYNVAPTSVGVAIRRAIDRSWGFADFQLEYNLFGRTVEFKRGMPTCGDFIANTTMYLLMNRRYEVKEKHRSIKL